MISVLLTTEGEVWQHFDNPTFSMTLRMRPSYRSTFETRIRAACLLSDEYNLISTKEHEDVYLISGDVFTIDWTVTINMGQQ